MLKPDEIAAYIDHTLLAPDATEEQIEKLCNEAKSYKFAAVCVNGTHTKLCRQLLEGSSVKVCTVVGFPLGASKGEVKAFETAQAVKDGAQEIDMVINIGLLDGAPRPTPQDIGSFAKPLKDSPQGDYRDSPP